MNGGTSLRVDTKSCNGICSHIDIRYGSHVQFQEALNIFTSLPTVHSSLLFQLFLYCGFDCSDDVHNQKYRKIRKFMLFFMLDMCISLHKFVQSVIPSNDLCIECFWDLVARNGQVLKHSLA